MCHIGGLPCIVVTESLQWITLCIMNDYMHACANENICNGVSVYTAGDRAIGTRCHKYVVMTECH